MTTHRITLLLLSLLFLFSNDSASAQFEVEAAFPALSFDRPVDLQHAGDGTNRLFVVEQHTGRIMVFPNDPSVTNATIFLDLDNINTGNEEGLLGLAFHPDYENNGYFFVNYSASNPRRTVIARYSVESANPNQADPNSQVVIMTINQPYNNHNGGQLAFGPDDGYLYIGLGDGGSGGDPGENGQDPKTLLGSVLRIDIDNFVVGGPPYSIPADNPFVGNTEGFREEIFAFGLRNPWRFSFDPPTGDLWLGDVGQGQREEINVIENGGNYGWDTMEASLCFEPSNGCNEEGLTLPVWEYGRSLGSSVSGGYVYRESRVPELEGKYIYADFVSGRIWALTYDGTNPASNEEIHDASFNIPAFGTSENEDFFILSFNGKIYKFVETQSTATEELPEIPARHATLGTGYPNPFQSAITLPYTLETEAKITLAIYDALGRRVHTLVDKKQGSGDYNIRWYGQDDAGNRLPNGVYFANLYSNDAFVQASGFTLMR